MVQGKCFVCGQESHRHAEHPLPAPELCSSCRTPLYQGFCPRCETAWKRL